MAYRPKTVQSPYKRGDSGIAKVQLNGEKTKARITFDEDGKVVVTSEFPKGMKAGTWFITLNSENNKVFSYRPVSGVFTGKVQKFVSKEDQDPIPQTHIGKDWSYQYFTVLLEITKGDNKGIAVPCMLRYHFTEAEEDEKKVVAYSQPRSKYTPILIEFCDMTGVWDRGPMPFKDNLLPMMQKRIMSAAKEFQFIMKKGYVDGFMPLNQPVSEELPEEEEKEEE